jgi:hypothetical protein
MLLGTSTLVAAATLTSGALVQAQKAAAPATPAAPSGRKPNILVIFGDDIGQTNISAYSFGLMGYKTPNIDRIAREGMMFPPRVDPASLRVNARCAPAFPRSVFPARRWACEPET